MKKILLFLLAFISVAAWGQVQTSGDVQVYAPGGVNFANGDLLIVHSGNGAPASSCSSIATDYMYVQLDAPAGQNIWQCINGTMRQQSGGVSTATIGQLAIYTGTNTVGGIGTTGTAGYVVLSGGSPTFTGSPALGTATANSINGLILRELATDNIGLGNSALNSGVAGNGTDNLAIGDSALASNTLGSENIAVGGGALQWTTSINGLNTAVGYAAGALTNSSAHNTASYNSVYIGGNSTAAASGDSNEIVIGYAAAGNGTNSLTLGNSSISGLYVPGLAVGGSANCLQIDSSGKITATGSSCGTASLAFGSLTSGTNTAATMTVGSGAMLGFSGSGSINASNLNGVSYPASPSTNTVPVVTSSNTITYEAVPTAAGGTGQNWSSSSGIPSLSSGTASLYNSSCSGANNALTWNSSTKSIGCNSISTAAGSIVVGTTSITSGTDGYIEYNNAGTLGERATTGSGNVVLATSPSISSPTLSSTVTVSSLSNGIVAANSSGALSSVTENDATYSATPTFSAASNIVINTITLTGNVTSSSFTGTPYGGQQMTMIICQDSAGGHTFTWPANMQGTMTISTTANKCSSQLFVYAQGLSGQWYAVNTGVINQSQ